MRREGTEAKGESGRESKRKKERGEKTEVMGTKDRERGVGGVMMKREVREKDRRRNSERVGDGKEEEIKEGKK